MLKKELLVKKRLITYGVGAITIPLLIGAGILGITGRCSSPKIDVPPPISQTVIAPALALSEAFTAVATYVKPTVVTVYSEKLVRQQSRGFDSLLDDDFFQRFFGQVPNLNRQPKTKEYKIPGVGSGMVLDKSGHILTNYHVVKEVDEVKVRFPDKREFKAEVVSTDPKTDIAVIRIKGVIPKDLLCVQFGNSDLLRVGEVVMAIGAPFDLTQTVTTGIISAMGRSDVGISDYEDFLQTDAPINPGNSGGPLVNMRGEVIGMNTAIATNSGQSAGIGFAIPSNMIKSMLPTLIKGGKITRGMLGVNIQELNKDLAKGFNLSNINGALITAVFPDSTAEKIGVKVGDVVTHFNDKEINSTKDLRNLVAATNPGTSFKLEIIRTGKKIILTGILGEVIGEIDRFGSKTSKSSDDVLNLGITIQTLTPILSKQYGLTEKTGIVVTSVDENSNAAQAGLHEGDIILEVNHQRVNQISECRKILTNSKGNSSVLLLIKRKDGNLFIAIQL
jgi:serine protease Do